MQFEQLPEDLQGYILDLKHGPRSLLSAVEDALEQASSLEEFRNFAETGLIDDMASYEDAVNRIAGKTVVELIQHTEDFIRPMEPKSRRTVTVKRANIKKGIPRKYTEEE